jgi:hydroxyacylglutathione hydrolase
LIIETLEVGPIATNCYLVGDESTRQAAVIDPGGDVRDILSMAEELHLEIIYVIDTHAHFDHMAGNAELMAATGARLILHRGDAALLSHGGGAAVFGILDVASPPADTFVSDGDTIQIGELALNVLHTPGHTPGGISLYSAAEGVLFSGDLLFYSGIGRTDLPGGDYDTILLSLSKVLSLPDNTLVYPGHGPATTIGFEKRNNPFLD